MATSSSTAVSAAASIETVETLRRAARATRVFVAGVQADQWTVLTNCDMSVRALVNHIVAGLGWAAELASGASPAEIGSRFDGDVLGEDPLAAYDRAAAAAVAAFGQPGGMEQVCGLPYGDVPGAVFCGHKLLDVFIHGWDIARTTGQPATLDPELAQTVYALFKPQERMLQASGVLGTPGPLAADSDVQTLLLAMLGRDNRA